MQRPPLKFTILHRYGVQPKLLFLLSAILIAFSGLCQSFQNLDFTQRCDTSKTGLCGWDLSWGVRGSVRYDWMEKRNCLLLSGRFERDVAFAEQSSQFIPLKEVSLITVTAFIKSDSVVGKGAGLNIGVYNSEGQLIATKDMGGFYSVNWVKGSGSWKRYSISLVTPVGASKIKVGAILFGKGKAWFSGYKVEMALLNHRRPSKLAVEYIGAACDSIALHSLLRDSIDIASMRKTALQIAGPAKKYSDCYTAVSYLLESLRPLGDEHSFFMSKAEVDNWKEEGSQVSKIQFCSARIIDDCGYVLVPPFHGGNPKQMLAYADSLQRALEKNYSAGIKGWIIDLRENTGGNMEPMIAGLGPLFSAEKLGALIDVRGQASYWCYKNGGYGWDGEISWSVTRAFVVPKKLPIAILTSAQTGSSGEIVAISFRGNENTRSFGQPTWGLTTGNGSFELKDGSKIFLASTVMSDRNGHPFHKAVEPDIFIEANATSGKDEVLAAALQWIHQYK